MHFNQVEFLAFPDEVVHARVSSMRKLVEFLSRGNILGVGFMWEFVKSCKFVFCLFCHLPFSCLASPGGNDMPCKAHLSLHLSD